MGIICRMEINRVGGKVNGIAIRDVIRGNEEMLSQNFSSLCLKTLGEGGGVRIDEVPALINPHWGIYNILHPISK